MNLHPVLLEKLNAGLEPARLLDLTPRDVRLPEIAGKVHAVIGMRRVGKTTFLRQLQRERQQAVGPERAVYVSFDDDRLADLPLAELDRLLEAPMRREVSAHLLQLGFRYVTVDLIGYRTGSLNEGVTRPSLDLSERE